MAEVISHIDELIINYLTNEIDDNGRTQLDNWIAESDENKDYFYHLMELWTSYAKTDDGSKYDEKRAFELFKNRVFIKKTATRKRRYNLLRYAAILLLFISVSLIAFRGGQRNVKTAFADIVVEAPIGSNTKLILPDGTTVWLNAGSQLTYSQGFGVDDRSVRINGEGYFEVKKNAVLPFNVSSDNLNITVLGTKFNFSDYRDDAQAIVSLNEGKVMLRQTGRGEKYYLKPNQRAIFDKKTGGISFEDCTASNDKQWIDDRIVFNGETFAAMARKLERSYNVKINITNDSIRRLHFYGNFVTCKQNIREVLKDLSNTGKFRYQMKGQNITIY